jgi:acetate kinase
MASTSLRILTVNSGSSSIKFSLYAMGSKEEILFTGSISRIGLQGSFFSVRGPGGSVIEERYSDVPDHDAAFSVFFAWFRSFSADTFIDAVGHRIVHGGSRLVEPHTVTRDVLDQLARLALLAPEHLPHEIKAIKAVERLYPTLVQVVCFDTAFHRNMPQVARMYPLPRFLLREGVYRYGFHGLSYEYIVGELEREAGKEVAHGRVVVAHLGNGASMAAVSGGQGIETTMGFTPTGGLMMGKRSGDLDPGVLLYLLQEKGMRPSTVQDIVNEHAGLQAVSGITSDMRELLVLEATEAHAAQAVALFCYSAKKALGALAAVLAGVDTLVFTGGVGENSPIVRERICSGLEFLGITIDTALNDTNAPIVSRAGAGATVRVMKTDEELMIARHTLGLTRRGEKKRAGSQERTT